MKVLKKYRVIFIIIGLIIIGVLIYYFLLLKENNNNNNNTLNFRIINNNDYINDTQLYYLFSDNNNMYYLRGKNPNDIFILISSIGVIDDNIYNLAVKKFQNKQKSFEIDGNILRMNNVKYSLYSLELGIDEFMTKMNVEKEPYENIEFKATDYEIDVDKNRTLYYTDKNGVKIYNENLKYIKIIDKNNKKFELFEFLAKYNLPSDVIYNIFELENSTFEDSIFLLSDSTQPSLIKAIQYRNLRVSCYYENNEIFYVMSYENEKKN